MQGINHARQSHVPVWLATHCAQAQSSGATCDLSAADSSPFPATQACESRRYGTGLQPVAPAWAIPSYHSTPRAMHTPAHMVTSPSHLHTSPPTRPDSAQVSQHVPPLVPGFCIDICVWHVQAACAALLPGNCIDICGWLVQAACVAFLSASVRFATDM